MELSIIGIFLSVVITVVKGARDDHDGNLIANRIPLLKSSLASSASPTSKDASPYWKDVEGRPTSSLPPLNYEHLKPHLTCSSSTRVLPCSSSEHYRRIDGFCNNPIRPSAGTPGDAVARIAKPQYDKGIFRMLSKTGEYLPNPRLISRTLQTMKRRSPHETANLFWLFFGQFVDHDMTAIPTVSSKSNPMKPVNCKSCRSWADNIACAPILVPRNDSSIPSVDSFGSRNCIPFTRSAATATKHRNEILLSQINEVTAYLDLSTVYGSDVCSERKLRLYNYGALLELNHPASSKGMAPLESSENFKDCRSHSGKCARTGDTRNNEQLGIMVSHILFLREHNRLAKKLKIINPHWTDETLYQEARKINIAQYQRIVYENFLPLMVGKFYTQKYDLNLQPLDHAGHSLFHEGYNEKINPQVLTEFASAAFRVHTVIPNHVIIRDYVYLPTGSFPLTELFMNSTYLMEKNMMEDLALGMIGTRLEGFDPVVEDNLSNKLFIRDSPFTAEDLIAINIARARDHGIPGYSTYRKLCGLSEIKSWHDIQLDKKDLTALQRIYKHVDDIDLFVGGVTEPAMPDSVVGPTVGCIIAYQFHNSRKGDKFWFENRHNHFTSAQLNAIRSGNVLHRILAFNLDSVHYLPRYVFELPDVKRNPLISSSTVRDLDFLLWKDKPSRSDIPKSCHFKDARIPDKNFVNVSPCLKCICRNGKIHCNPFDYSCAQPRDHFDESCRLLCGTA